MQHTKVKQRNIWTDKTSKYGTYAGEVGSPIQWAAAFKYVKMTKDHALGILHNESPLAILGLKFGATENEIKKAMRTLALKHHPDKGGDVTMFNKIMAAYTLLAI